jgi:hypothetical protein
MRHWRDEQPRPWETLGEYVMRRLRGDPARRLRTLYEEPTTAVRYFEPSWVVTPAWSAGLRTII